MKQTSVEWLEAIIKHCERFGTNVEQKDIDQAKEMEKEQMDNKVIHFAEWLTKKHCYTLIALYEHLEEEFYKEKLD